MTTSGGSTRLQRNGVCEKCNSLIQQYVETTSTASQDKVEGETESWMSKINEEKADQEVKQPSSPSGTGFGRLKRQRSKSGNTQRIDSSGNALQKKVLRNSTAFSLRLDEKIVAKICRFLSHLSCSGVYINLFSFSFLNFGAKIVAKDIHFMASKHHTFLLLSC